MQFDLNYQDGIFEVKNSGDATLQGYFDLSKAVIEHEKWQPGGLVLLDNTKLNTGPLTIDEVREIANIAGQYRTQIGCAKLAVLVDRDLDYGISRMWQVFFNQSGLSSATEKLFRNRDEAVTWLKSV